MRKQFPVKNSEDGERNGLENLIDKLENEIRVGNSSEFKTFLESWYKDVEKVIGSRTDEVDSSALNQQLLLKDVLPTFVNNQNILHIIASLVDCRERNRIAHFIAALQTVSGDKWNETLMQADNFGNSALHYAALYKRKLLLDWYIDHVNFEMLFMENNNKMSPLHYLADAKKFEFVNRVRKLYEACGSHSNMVHKFIDKSPLHLAASKGSTEMTRYLSEILNKNITDYTIVDDDGMAPLHYGIVFSDEIMSKSELVQEVKRRLSFLLESTPWSAFRTNRFQNSPLHVAAKYGKHEILKYLLNYKVNIDENSDADHRKDSLKKIKSLRTAANLNKNGENILHSIAQESVSGGHIKCVQLILNHVSMTSSRTLRRICLQSDKSGLTPLDKLIEYENVQICSIILMKFNQIEPCIEKFSKWLSTTVFRSITDPRMGLLSEEPLIQKLYSSMPDALLPIFDTCIEKNNEYSKRNFKSTVNFGPIIGWRNHNEDNFPESEYIQMVNTHETSVRNNVLEHELVQSFIREKWHKVKWFLLVGFSLQMFHIFFFTLFSYSVFKECTNESGDHQGEGSSTEPPESGLSMNCNIPVYTTWERFFGFSVFFLSIGFAIKELYQLFCRYGKDMKLYIRSFSNWIQVLFILITLITTCQSLVGKNEQIISKWNRMLSSLGVIIGGMLTLYEFKKVSEFGPISRIFKKVAKKSGILLGYYLMLIITFMVAFRVLSPQNSDFTFPAGIVKTVTMMVGEYEFEEHFEHAELLWRDLLILTKLVVFTTFIFVAAIVGLNLLIGLAVDNIQALKEDANLEMLSTKLDQIYNTEKFIFSLQPVLPKSIFIKLAEHYNIILKESNKNTSGDNGDSYKTEYKFHQKSAKIHDRKRNGSYSSVENNDNNENEETTV